MGESRAVLKRWKVPQSKPFFFAIGYINAILVAAPDLQQRTTMGTFLVFIV